MALAFMALAITVSGNDGRKTHSVIKPICFILWSSFFLILTVKRIINLIGNKATKVFFHDDEFIG